MMDLINEDIAKHIWGFFLEFDGDDDMIPSKTVETSSLAALLARRVDFQSIRSLRCVNKLFYNAFQEVSGWSWCALAIKREYRNLKNDEKLFDNWSLTYRLHALRANQLSPIPDTRSRWTTNEERQHVLKIVTKAMERKTISVYRCNQLIRLLDRGPFTKDEKLLTNRCLFPVQ